MQSPNETKPRWERRKDARPQELLAAALELFTDRGFAATRLEDVARAAGVSKGTLYLYFENKQELFKAVVRDNIVQVIGEAEEVLAAAEDISSEDLLRAMLEKWWNHASDRRAAGLNRLMMAESGNFPELAQFYEVGQQVPRNMAVARDLYAAAASHGMKEAQARLDQLGAASADTLPQAVQSSATAPPEAPAGTAH